MCFVTVEGGPQGGNTFPIPETVRRDAKYTRLGRMCGSAGGHDLGRPEVAHTSLHPPDDNRDGDHRQLLSDCRRVLFF